MEAGEKKFVRAAVQVDNVETPLRNTAAVDPADSRPLYERLQEQRRVKDDEEQKRHSLANLVPQYDEEDVDFLNSHARRERDQRAAKRAAAAQEMDEFKAAQREQRRAPTGDSALAAGKPLADARVGGKAARAATSLLLGGGARPRTRRPDVQRRVLAGVRRPGNP